jgi:voltage-gated potassium channel
MNDLPSATAAKVGVFQLAILVLTIINLGALIADTTCALPKEVSVIIQRADTAVCLIFLVDFFVRLRHAESKRAFLKWGWIDLLASIPNLELLRWGRFVRVLRVLRLLRGIRSVHKVLTMLFQNKMEGGIVSLGLAAFLLITFASASILTCEQQSDSNIKTAEDAVWWSVTTMTTVGYGDKYPVTTEGRIIGMVLMVAGVGMFCGLSGMVASLFLGGQDRKPSDAKEILARLDQLQAKLDAMTSTTLRHPGGGQGGRSKSRRGDTASQEVRVR